MRIAFTTKELWDRFNEGEKTHGRGSHTFDRLTDKDDSAGHFDQRRKALAEGRPMQLDGLPIVVAVREQAGIADQEDPSKVTFVTITTSSRQTQRRRRYFAEHSPDAIGNGFK